jgi:tRNA threonylcarbamoyladenosine biosynthesis protein TsaE
VEKVLQIISRSPEQTLGLAEKLATTCFLPGDVLVLSGHLGAGKTLFVRGLAKGLGLDPDSVNSPSFTFVNEYPGEKPLYHFDLYRMGDLSELQEIGWDEYLSRDGIVAIEWGEKAGPYLPDKYYRLEFTVLDETEREIAITFERKS